MHNRALALTAAAALAFTAAACSPSNENSSTSAAPSTTATSAQETAHNHEHEHAGNGFHAHDGVVREKGADSDMTAIFGNLHNPSDKDVVITGFTTSLNAPINEIHETVNGKMQKMTTPLVIPAGESIDLEPGGAHFMIMGYPEEIKAGDTVEVSVTLDDGSTVDLGDFAVRAIGAGDEEYGSEGHEGHEGHGDHAGHEGHEGH
ncbi:copper chaperone PCu(A)C [Corynebacterium tapiri]|uniref:Copper chaperone PCu(A)C n=1 Tax=Corynebacterium tapiri TaxID=1448266 RepID=A0A5C4U4W9_9CORY|nr:copper chaperone PCu(A)C [Corynebacterium tapiri]